MKLWRGGPSSIYCGMSAMVGKRLILRKADRIELIGPIAPKRVALQVSRGGKIGFAPSLNWACVQELKTCLYSP